MWVLHFAGVLVVLVATAVHFHSDGLIHRLLRMPQYRSATFPMTQEVPVRIGILGTPPIAKHALIWPARKLPSQVAIQAIASRDTHRARTYASAWQIPIVFDTYHDLVASDKVGPMKIKAIEQLCATATVLTCRNSRLSYDYRVGDFM
eukprot:m.1232670 g.1232670  ORF g.1232670 m.1232670 type:complete len:148 (+) comp24661_c2_seq10:1030-1473(+)